MTHTKEKAPGISTEGREDSALTETLTTSIVPGPTGYWAVGASVERQLSEVLDKLLSGETGLDELTPSLAGFYHCGYAAGVSSREAEIMRLEDQRNRYYRAAFDTDYLVRDRMNEAFRETFDAMVAESEEPPLIAYQSATDARLAATVTDGWTQIRYSDPEVYMNVAVPLRLVGPLSDLLGAVRSGEASAVSK